MKKLFLFILLAFGTVNLINAQKAASSIFFELGGPGLASINYDRRFSHKEDGLGFRAGFGGLEIDHAGGILVPLGLNYLLGKDNKNYFELGAGVTIVSGGDGSGDTFQSTFGHLNFGYRLQPRNGGFTFRAAINPVFGNGFFIPYYGGVSFGYKF
ncbi:MAG: hypothetical protein JWN76_453 [Chitinophagaceae bacterium]|nr:hypothetical protein [Chitinophagaceae bacterium]